MAGTVLFPHEKDSEERMPSRKQGIRRRRQRRRAANRRTAYLTNSQRKNIFVGRTIFVLSSVIALAAFVIVGIFVYNKYLKDTVIKTGEIIANKLNKEETEPETTVTETTVVEETKPDPEAERNKKKEEQAAFEKYVLSIEPGVEFAHFSGEPTLKLTGDDILDRANRAAAEYDYDTAIDLIKGITGYGNIQEYTDAIATYTAEKQALKPFQINNNVTHIFFHSLVVDPDLAFDPETAGGKAKDYNDAMTTVSEFAAILEDMYKKGYVLTDIYDLVRMEKQPDGTEKMAYQTILLPEGKQPFILSVDDTNYYEYMTGHGFPDRLVVAEDGRVLNEMTLTDGTVVTGAFDVLPILEDFIDLHPDFCYRGGRAIMAVTGYNGVLGYRTSDFWYNDECDYYEPTEENNKYKREDISGSNPNITADKVTAMNVAEAIKAMNWRFASHTWGHKRLGQVAMETLVWDSDMWAREVEPIVGSTDLLVFPYGNDFGPASVSWQVYDYDGYNERYETMRSYGFRYFFNVDSSAYYMQRTDDYFRQGRRNVDGTRMWQAVHADRGEEKFKNRLTDLLDDVSAVIDSKRPDLYPAE